MAVGAMAQQQPKNDDGATAELESSLSRAVQLRAPYIKKQSHQLTLPSVRRLLERDLRLQNLFLEEHKAVIKGLVDEVLNESYSDADDLDAVPEEVRKRGKKNSRVVEDLGRDAVPEETKKRRKENPRVVEDLQDEQLETHTIDGNSYTTRNFLNVDKGKPTKTDVDDSEDEDKPGASDGGQHAEISDIQGTCTEIQSEKHWPIQERSSNQITLVPKDEGDVEETLHVGYHEETIRLDLINTNENAIRVALSGRAAELKSQAETLTVTKVRHLLEKDLGLERDRLQVHKQFIRTLVDELLGATSEVPKIDERKGEHEREEEGPVKSKGRPKYTEDKFSMGRTSAVGEAIEDSEENLQGNGEVSDSVSVERRQSKLKKLTKQQKKDNEVRTKPVIVKQSTDSKRPFTAKVERLRGILKFVGVGVSPISYRKARQVPEDEREEVLIRELEKRLAQEGLSSNPTEKAMKKVKARLARKRDLDGIERSNIMEAPRRSRTASNSWFAPRPNRYAQAADEDSEDQDSKEDSRPVVTGAMDD